ncbi:Maf family protein [Microbulbifer agarilyticus]|uniref:Maf family protein n=1 Tax=Microbulbifer agarilyticus TaxID=260552 RepID=UPI001CD27E5C|nr:Maf family protein [Microbulbifer agarilyticus]MCA0901029.1 Maf family nucleotide pyrophosphatase [Microbulbifer agarilyticus]
MRNLILASSSSYRRELLSKLHLNFESCAPHINEEVLPGEAAGDLASRLAREKALALADRYPDHLIIGSDQVAECRGTLLGKPGTKERAKEQLTHSSGHTVNFHTGLCLVDTRDMSHETVCETYSVHFRELTRKEITRYVELDHPLDCAGSFKSEGLGIALFEKMEGSDPNTLIGLPLIRLVELLRHKGINPLDR